MSTYPQPQPGQPQPRLEARVSAQEQYSALLHARLVEIAQDMTASFKQQADYQIAFEQRITAEITEVKTEIAAARKELKAEMAAMETRILDAFQQLVSLMRDTRGGMPGSHSDEK